MNIKVIGSVIRWVVVTAGTIGVFVSDPSFSEALKKLADSFSNGDLVTIVGSVVTVATLGWSIWDKVKTQRTEVKLKGEIAHIKMLSAKMIEKKEVK
jgi:uncharacterized membrane protein